MTDADWKEFYGKCWDILVEHAGAHNDDSGHNRAGFIHTMLDEGYSGCQEYRFCGALGFGGKLRRNSNNDYYLYIDCYPEDSSPKTEAIIKKVNALLRELQDKMIGGPVFGPPKLHTKMEAAWPAP